MISLSTNELALVHATPAKYGNSDVLRKCSRHMLNTPFISAGYLDAPPRMSYANQNCVSNCMPYFAANRRVLLGIMPGDCLV
jgi:hypothetical protein